MRRLLTIVITAAACGSPVDTAGPAGDLPVGDVTDDYKADGTWGAALTCKPVPSLPSLVSPRIVISLDGLTLHLTDPATGYDKVFPVGPGMIEDQESDAAFGESKSYYPAVVTGKNDFFIRSDEIQTCKTWWTDPETKQRMPVFGGLPFMPFYGNYAVHGPIDNFRAPNGGSLRRGFVSHGCVRMQAADVLEVYARIRGVRATPVHLQREPERDAQGRRVDISTRWIGAECQADADCNYAGGLCQRNRWSERGFCTARCSSACADRAGQPPTFCVADPDRPSVGICMPKVLPQDQACKPFDHFVPVDRPRLNQPAVHATVCLPGSPGWIGDHCFADAECGNGTRCAGASASAPGTCTESCSGFCPDEPGWPGTFCAADGACARSCTPQSNASECAGGTTCQQVTRAGGAQRWACR